MVNRIFKSVMIGVGAYLFAIHIGEFDNQSAAVYGAFIGVIIFVLEKEIEGDEDEQS